MLGVSLRTLCAGLVALGASAAASPSFAEDAALVLVAPARDTNDARRAAHALAGALRVVARVREIAPTLDPRAAMAESAARAIVVIDDAPDAFLLVAFGVDGRSWAPRPVARATTEPVLLEQVAAAGVSMVAAMLSPAPEGTKVDSSSSAVEAPSPPPAVPPESRSSSSPASSSPAPSRAIDSHGHDEAPRAVPMPSPRGRIDATFTAANIGSSLPVHAGAGLAGWWVPSSLHVGAAYAFYPGVVVHGPDASLLITRHAFALAARIALPLRDWEIAGAAGPLVEIWLRSTRDVSTALAAAPSSTYAAPGAFARADVTRWVTPTIGADAGIALEVSPWSPRFRGPLGADELTPTFARVRGDVGLAARF